MKTWYRYILKNPTRILTLFYVMLVWRILSVYMGAESLSLVTVSLHTITCYVLYGALKGLIKRRGVLLCVVLLPVCLLIAHLLESHMIYALYRAGGVRWSIDPAVLVALYPLLLMIWFLVQDRYFPPLGAAVALPFVLFSWFTLIQERVKVWIILYLFFSLIDAAVWVYLRAGRRSRRLGLRGLPSKRTAVVSSLVAVCLTAALFFPLSAIGTKSIHEILNPEGTPSGRIVEFDLYSLGYGDSDRLGGPIDLDDEVLMTVEADRALYLRGDVKSLYTGHAWESDSRDMKRQGEYAVHEADKDSPRYLEGTNARMRVFPESAQANALFTPLHAIYIEYDANVWHDQHYVFYSLRRRNKTAPYTVLYKDIDCGEAYDYPLDSLPGVYDRYLQVPDTITQRTYDLVRDITRDARTVSDKVEAIRQHLADNYTYSLFMTTPPADVDFVEHFLFTEGKGYCTYFATSAAVMCRIAGIPTRYVQGFLLDPDKTDQEGRYRVSGAEGHAWIEVLVSPEERLWTSVECTPSQDTQSDSLGLLPAFTPPPIDVAAVPVNLADLPARRGFIARHPVLFALLLLVSAGILLFAGVLIRRRVRQWNSVYTDESILPFYRRVRERLIPTGIFANGARTDMDEALAAEDSGLRRYLVPIVAQYYDEVYGGMRIDRGIDRREAYRYIASYAKHNKRKK